MPDNQSDNDYFDVVIVGGGFGGNAQAAAILKRQLAIHHRTNTRKLRISIIEKSPARLFGGVAYSLASSEHQTNTPAAVMALLRGDTTDVQSVVGAKALRKVMQRDQMPAVVERTVMRLKALAEKRGHVVQFVSDEVVNIEGITSGSSGVTATNVHTINGRTFKADALVLASGTSRSVAHPAVLELLESVPREMRDKVVIDFWREREKVEGIFEDARRHRRATGNGVDVLVIGTGLTGLDAVVTANAHKFFEGFVRGDVPNTMTLVSRGGNRHPTADYTRPMPTIEYADLTQRWADRLSYAGQTPAQELRDFVVGVYDHYRDLGFENWQITRAIAPHAARFVHSANIDKDAAWSLLRQHSSLVATTSVGVGGKANGLLDRLVNADAVQITTGEITDISYDRFSGDFTSSLNIRDGRTDGFSHFAVISALGTDLSPDAEHNRDYTRRLLEQGIVVPHQSGRGYEVTDEGFLRGSNGRIYGLGSLTVGSMTELYGRTGPLALNAEACAILAEQNAEQITLLANGRIANALPKIDAPAFAKA